MAFLKDLLVTGVTRITGILNANKVNTSTILAPISEGSSTFGPGERGQFLVSNGSTVYWATLNHKNFTSGSIVLKQPTATDVSQYALATVQIGTATTPTASAAATSTALDGTTLTVSRDVTPTVSPGWVASGTKGTVTITATVPTETFTASASGDFYPNTGKLINKVSIAAGKAVMSTAQVQSTTTTLNNGVITLKRSLTPTVTAGWIASGTAATVTMFATVPAESVTVAQSKLTVASGYGTISSASDKLFNQVKVPMGTISTGSTNNSTWTENTSAVVPAEGYLYINEGWYPNTQISLATLIPDDITYVNATSGKILQNHEAYDIDGKKLIGTIESWVPSATYYTTTNTGYGTIPQYKYINTANANYIKQGAIGSTGADVAGSTNVTLTTDNNGIAVTGSGKGIITTAGWISKDETASTASTLTKYISAITVPSKINFDKVTLAAGANVDGTNTYTTLNVKMDSYTRIITTKGTTPATMGWIYIRNGLQYLHIADNDDVTITNLYVGANNGNYSGVITNLRVGATTERNNTKSSSIGTLVLRGYNTNTSYPDKIDTLNIGTSATYKNAKVTTINNYGTITSIAQGGNIGTLGGTNTIGTLSTTGTITTWSGTSGTVTTLSGTKTITTINSSGYLTIGTLTGRLYINAATDADTSSTGGYGFLSVLGQTILQDGAWKTTNISATTSSGTYYGKVVYTQPTQQNASSEVILDTTTTSKSYSAGYYGNAHGAKIILEEKTASAAGAITPTSGKVLSKVTVPSGTAGAVTGGAVTGTNIELVTANTNNGIQIQRAASSYQISKAGWISSAGSQLASTTVYAKGVKLVPPAAGAANREFYIQVPNGNTTDYITFTFKVDSTGNVWVE